jgi:ADP-heptose:LPS heptosyltransferase
VPHILVIRLSALGDVAMLVPVLRVLTATYPMLNITVVTRGFLAPLFDDLKNVVVLPVDVKGVHKGFLGLFQLAKDAKKLKITGVADTHNVLRSKIVRSLLWLQAVKTASIDKARGEKKQLTQAKGGKLQALKKTHERYADVFAKLGYPIDLTKHQFPARKVMSAKTQEISGLSSKKFIGVAPFAAHKAKMYPIHLIKKVLQELSNSGEYTIFLFGGGATEIAQLDKLSEGFKGVVNMAGKLSFTQELELISNLDIMLAMDSGNGHLAALYDIPVLTLWGVTHPSLGFAPFNQPTENQLFANRTKYPLVPTSVYGNSYPDGYEKAIETISPNAIVEKVLSVLK